jgi:hypothetical protein
MEHNDNHSWNSYSRLVLNELERLNDNVEKNSKEISKLCNKVSLVQKEVDQHRDVDEKTFLDLAGDIKDIREELVTHVKEVNEVWSPKQMQQVKNEVYRQKNHMAKIAGVVIAVQVIIGILVAFGKDIISKF